MFNKEEEKMEFEIKFQPELMIIMYLIAILSELLQNQLMKCK